MNKKDRIALDKKIQEKLNPFYLKKGYQLDEKLFIYTNDCFTVFWGDASDFGDWLSFRPNFQILNSKIKNNLSIVFPDKSNVVSNKSQDLQMAKLFGVCDFDCSIFVDLSDNGIEYSNYSYKIGIDTDLQPIIKDHIQFMEKVTFPYFEKLSTVKGISDYFNNRLLALTDEELKDRKVMKSFQKEEVLCAIIASYLENEERLTEVIDTYKKLYSTSEFYFNDINVLDNWIKDNNEVN